MIKLKSEVNKAQLLKELKEAAEAAFKESWQPELQVKAYMDGAKDLLEKLKTNKNVQKNHILLPNDGKKE